MEEEDKKLKVRLTISDRIRQNLLCILPLYYGKIILLENEERNYNEK